MLTSVRKVRTIEYMRRSLYFLLLFCLVPTLLRADGSAFDLAGPKVDVHVKRGMVTLPISEVPNLLPGDRLWIHPDLPESQSAHFVLVVAFLRGSTNPPPPEWFTRVETWSREAHDEGVFVTVPAEAQQALLFLAPETGGDFNTLRKAVRGQPGTFVRADQDLEAASWERMRLEAYLADVKVTSQTDPKALKARAEMAARSLGIKINESCFSKPADEQAACLSQNSEGMVLDDTNEQSLVNQLANGSTMDLMNQLSYSAMGGGGMYSPYVGAVVDIAKILGSLHTAHFQYIPALALPTTDTLNLRLNMPPSFRNPKSVVVVALPPIGPARPEPLHPVNPEESFCGLKPGLVLPAEGAPLAYATPVAHELVMHVEAQGGSAASAVDVPVKADSGEGGLVPVGPMPALPAGPLTAVIRGKWGFDDWEGPRFHLYAPRPGVWSLAAGDQSALVVGRDDTLHLDGDSALCVQKIEQQTAGGEPVNVAWKVIKPSSLEVTAPLKDAAPGPVVVSVYEYGLKQPDKLRMTAYEEAASLDRLTLSAGDTEALLKGNRLDEVARAELAGIALTPDALSRAGDFDELMLKAAGSTANLTPGGHYMAHVELKDGRRLKAPVTVEPPRPQVTLLNKGVQNDAATTPQQVQLGSPDDLPLEGRLVFFLRADTPAEFPRTEKVEVAATDGSFHTFLQFSDGSLILEDARTAVATLDPLKRFGPSAFGPVQVRAVSEEGVTGDWLPLGTLVRVPGFKELRCPHSMARPCTLTGNNLFLADSLSTTPDFSNATDVPAEFTGTQLMVPHPTNGTLYLKLRDDPDTVQTLTLPVLPLPPSAQARMLTPAAEKPPAAAETPEDEEPGDLSAPGAPAETTPAAPPAEAPSAPQTKTPPAAQPPAPAQSSSNRSGPAASQSSNPVAGPATSAPPAETQQPPAQAQAAQPGPSN